MDKRLEAFQRLLNIMDDLRTQCPWDKKQTIESLRHLTIEETYELSEAIIENDMNEIKKELGDLMLHLVFYSKIASEKNAFDITDVLNTISDKLIFRHPHIYGDTKVNSAKEVADNWEKIKLTEGKKSVLEGVPRSLPPLIQAFRIQDKVSGVGFDWDNSDDVWNKINEELSELKNAENQKQIEEEVGDVLFSIINYARFVNVNPDLALAKTNQKFIKRFKFIEEKAKENKNKIQNLNIQQMEKLWQEAKKFD
jgi:XTP/dITP diphosphohydrolase